MKAFAQPEIVQKLASGSRATVEGYVRLTVIYLSEVSGRMSSLTQRLPFSRQFDLAKSAGSTSEVFANATMAYLNCRAVNPRRIDVRGALNITAKVLSRTGDGIVRSIAGDGVQKKEITREYLFESACEEKQFTLEETLEFDREGCETPRLLRSNGYAVVEDVELGDRRAVISGYVNVQIAADISLEDECRVKRAGFNLPFSQTVELMGGAATDLIPACDASIISCSVTPESDGSASVSAVCAIELRLFERASAQLLSDAFCTKCEIAISREIISLCTERRFVHQPVGVRFSGECLGAGVKLVDYFITEPSMTYEPLESAVHGVATLCCIVFDEHAELMSEEYPFEFTVRTDGEAVADNYYAKLDAFFENIECSISDGKISLRCEGAVEARIMELARISAVTNVVANENAAKTGTASALRVYYANAGEELWDIAKRFNASADEIALENSIAGSRTETAGPLLVPAAV
ncbi:MAG: DUF3794 domain-containing protein [Oscillospiraceae bacterium]